MSSRLRDQLRRQIREPMSERDETPKRSVSDLSSTTTFRTRLFSLSVLWWCQSVTASTPDLVSTTDHLVLSRIITWKDGLEPVIWGLGGTSRPPLVEDLHDCYLEGGYIVVQTVNNSLSKASKASCRHATTVVPSPDTCLVYSTFTTEGLFAGHPLVSSVNKGHRGLSSFVILYLRLTVLTFFFIPIYFYSLSLSCQKVLLRTH